MQLARAFGTDLEAPGHTTSDAAAIARYEEAQDQACTSYLIQRAAYYARESRYQEIDKLEEKIITKIEEVLMAILPEAFAVMKETARRFKENKHLRVLANDFDRELAAKRESIRIEGDEAIWDSTWIAAGNPVTWEMVHYDVQLIGGYVLHSGKIAVMRILLIEDDPISAKLATNILREIDANRSPDTIYQELVQLMQ